MSVHWISNLVFVAFPTTFFYFLQFSVLSLCSCFSHRLYLHTIDCGDGGVHACVCVKNSCVCTVLRIAVLSVQAQFV